MYKVVLFWENGPDTEKVFLNDQEFLAYVKHNKSITGWMIMDDPTGNKK